MASSWKAHRNKIHHKDDVLYGTDHSEVGSGTSSLNSAKRSSTSGSVPQSPVLGSRTIESELAKEKKKEKCRCCFVVLVIVIVNIVLEKNFLEKVILKEG